MPVFPYDFQCDFITLGIGDQRFNIACCHIPAYSSINGINLISHQKACSLCRWIFQHLIDDKRRIIHAVKLNADTDKASFHGARKAFCLFIIQIAGMDIAAGIHQPADRTVNQLLIQIFLILSEVEFVTHDGIDFLQLLKFISGGCRSLMQRGV